MEEYYLNERKIHMSEPEPGNGNVHTVYFVNQARENTQISRREFVCNVYLDLSLLLRKMFIKNILLQISFCALTLQVNVTIFSTKFEG